MSKGSKMRSTVGIRGPIGRRWLPAVWLTVVTLIGLGRAVSSAKAEESAQTIVFFGDSLTAGYGLDNPEAEAYPALIQRKLAAEHLPWRVVNAGLSGETTAGGVRRVDWVLRQPVGIFFLALGGNDGLRGIDPAVTEQNLGQIIDHVRAKYPAARIIIAGMEMPAAMGESYARRFHDVFAHVAEQKHVGLLPFLLAGVAGRSDLNQADGIHPTAAGDRVVAETVWKTLQPLL